METENRYTETDLGNVSLNPRGEYDATVSYEYLDTVSYQGGSYVCLAELGTTISGTAPESGHNTDSWQMIALPGDLTSEYIAMHDEVVNKAVQAETSRAAAELAQQAVEDAQADVQQLHIDTRQAAIEASQSCDSAAGYARSAEQSRTAATEAEQNINAQVAGFDTKVSESVIQAQEEITAARQQAVGTITEQQKTSAAEVKKVSDAALKSADQALQAITTTRQQAVKEVTDQRDTSIQTIKDETDSYTEGKKQEISNKTEEVTQSVNQAGEKQLQNIADSLDISLTKEGKAADAKSVGDALNTKITKFYASNQGNTHLADSNNGLIQDLILYGKSSQDGIPTPEHSVEIKSVVNPVIEVCGSNLLNLINVAEYISPEYGITVSCKNGNIKAKGTPSADIQIKIDIVSDTKKYKLKANKTYIFNPNPSRNPETDDAYIDFTNFKTLGFSRNSKNINTPITVNNEQVSADFALVIKCKKGIAVDMEWEPQLLVGNDILPYSSYTGRTIQIKGITLSAAPAATNGNVTIDGQQYVADYIDLERGKLVKYLYAGKLGDLQYTVNPAKDPKWYDASISNCFELTDLKYKGVTFKNSSLTTGFCNKAKTYGFAEFYGKNIEFGVMNKDAYIIVNLPISLGINTAELFREWSKECYIIKMLSTPIESDLTAEEIVAFKELYAYYPVTNISVASDQLDGYAVFNYPISLANGWNYVKQQLNDNRDYIYNMDLQSAEAYVNSEYAVALTELEVM